MTYLSKFKIMYGETMGEVLNIGIRSIILRKNDTYFCINNIDSDATVNILARLHIFVAHMLTIGQFFFIQDETLGKLNSVFSSLAIFINTVANRTKRTSSPIYPYVEYTLVFRQ